jgi:hypothetical protein
MLKHLLCLSFRGTKDSAKTYFLHGAGQIRHMLVMVWGGECTATMVFTPHLSREILRSNKEVEALGIMQEDPTMSRERRKCKTSRDFLIRKAILYLLDQRSFFKPKFPLSPIHPEAKCAPYSYASTSSSYYVCRT